MSTFVVAVFPDEAKAYEGTRALKELHAEGSLTVYAATVITKGADGKLSVKDSAASGPIGMAVDGLVGGLVGLLGGPPGAALGISMGVMVGAFGDLFNMGVGADFLDKVSEQLSPGKAAIVAEVAEDWVTPLDTRMAVLGGVVERQLRMDFEEELTEKQAKARQAEIARLKEELAHASGEAKAKLTARIDEASAKLKAVSDGAKAQVAKLKQETDAKISVLQDQAAKATADAKVKIERRIGELRANREQRIAANVAAATSVDIVG